MFCAHCRTPRRVDKTLHGSESKKMAQRCIDTTALCWTQHVKCARGSPVAALVLTHGNQGTAVEESLGNKQAAWGTDYSHTP